MGYFVRVTPSLPGSPRVYEMAATNEHALGREAHAYIKACTVGEGIVEIFAGDPRRSEIEPLFTYFA